MSLLIPEIIIQNALNGMLKTLRKDYAEQGQESDTLMYKVLNGLRVFNYDMYKQAKEVILTEKNKDARHVEVVLSYNPSDRTYPSVHITLPNEATGSGGAGADSIGFGEGDYDDNPDDLATQYERTFNRTFNAQYNIVIVSDNRNETILLYNMFKAGLIAYNEHLQLSGLQNLSISGGDLSFNQQIPMGLFFRSLQLKFFYDNNVPEWDMKDVIKKINFTLALKDE